MGLLKNRNIWTNKEREIELKILDAVLLGIALNNNVNRFLVINSKKKWDLKDAIIKVRDAKYFEDVFPFRSKISSSLSEYILSSRVCCPDMSFEDIELKRSKRERIKKNFGKDFVTYLVKGDPIFFMKRMWILQKYHFEKKQFKVRISLL